LHYNDSRFYLNMPKILLIVFAIAAPLLLASAADRTPDDEAIRAAVAKSLPLLENSSRTSMERRKQCFTCHNQALPLMALTVAKERGFAVDGENLKQQLAFTAGFLEKSQANYLAGRGQGGQALTAGYALWTLENGGWPPDATTSAVADYLLKWQAEFAHWKVQSIRPPSEESLFTVSYVAVRGLKKFSGPEQGERVERRVSQVRDWALKTVAKTTEDRAFRLRLLSVAGAPPAEIRSASEDLLRTQRSDGGWTQLDGMESDAYATGTALTALHQAGGVATSEGAYARGVRYLLSAQLADGSWHVATRSTPIQAYYESGYPHGEDQFISVSAAGWATTALAEALPKK
jgi:hypothetical protein